MISLFIMSIVGCSAPTQQETTEEVKEKVIPIVAEEVSTSEIFETYTYVAKLQPEKETMVISSISGKVEDVYYDLGDFVEAGAPLFSVNGTQTQQQIVSLEQQVSTAKIAMNDALEAFNDTKALYEMGAAPEQQYLQTKSAYDQSAISYNTAKANYDLVLQDLRKQNANLGGMLSSISINSPMTGIITARNIDEGDMLSASIVPFTIAQMDNLIIEVGVSENVVTKIAVEDKVDVAITSLSEEPFKGTVTAISPAANEQTGSFTVKVKIENPNLYYKPGMIANVSFKVDGKKDAIVVPIDAVLSDGEKEYCYVVQDDKAVEVDIMTGIDNGMEIQVTSGLQVGDQLIVKGQNYVYDTALVAEESELQDESTTETQLQEE